MTELQVHASGVVELTGGRSRDTDFTWTLVSFEERKQTWR